MREETKTQEVWTGGEERLKRINTHLEDELTIPGLQRACLADAEALGWTTEDIDFPEQCALLHSEVSEALESYRKREPYLWHDPTSSPPNKPCGIASEYADLAIRLFHYCEKMGIDLAAAIATKRRYNLTRGYRHGGKRI
jgi:NTP pyrophosphatase (non-canonical NTP hydrolase)